MTEGAIIVGACLVAITIRMIPEALLRGRAPPALIKDAMPWLPIVIAGTFVGVLHWGAAPAVRPEFLLAGVIAAATLAIRRTFYLPILAGVAFLATYRALLG